MTDLGKATLALARAYNLGAYYNPYVGNITIDETEFTLDVVTNVNRFLKENQDWVMGYEEYDDDMRCIYLVQRDEL